MSTITFAIFLASIARSIVFEHWSVKTNVRIKYIEAKWYIKPGKIGCDRVVKKYHKIAQVDVEWKSCQCQFFNT